MRKSAAFGAASINHIPKAQKLIPSYRVFLFAILAISISSLAAAAPPPGADAVVSQLYKDFAWEAVPGHADKPGLIDQPRAVLRRYFDDSLTNLILGERACVEQTHEICRLDFSPIWDSQDPAAKGLKVSATKDPGIVNVTFRYPESNELMELSYRMTKTKDGWRIHDITYHSHASLLSILNARM
jgi:ABC-type transporter MlaC component